VYGKCARRWEDGVLLYVLQSVARIMEKSVGYGLNDDDYAKA